MEDKTKRTTIVAVVTLVVVIMAAVMAIATFGPIERPALTFVQSRTCDFVTFEGESIKAVCEDGTVWEVSPFIQEEQ